MSNKIKIDIKSSPLVPAGEYKLRFKEHKLVPIFSGKITLSFEIISNDQYNGTELNRNYNYNKKKPLGQKSGFLREYVKLFGPLPSPDDIDLDSFNGHCYLGEVKTVTKDPQKRDIPEDLQYSTIRQLISIADENNSVTTEQEERFEDKNLGSNEENSGFIPGEDEIFDDSNNKEEFKPKDYYPSIDPATGEIVLLREFEDSLRNNSRPKDTFD